MGLLEAAFQIRDRWRAARYGPQSQVAPDGLPLPPPDLILLVAGTTDASWFLSAGARAAESVTSALAKNGLDIRRFRSILDFGCGCGRVIRHWRGLPARLHGCDFNRRLVTWCRRHLPFGAFAVNRGRPPLPYADGQFDFIYALSVFTHLPEAQQRPWMEELRRVAAPGAHVLLSLHGESYVPDLTAEEKQRFESGQLVVRAGEAAGRNACGAYHPPSYVREVLAEGFRLVDHLPEAAAGNPHQDLVLLRKD
jgi:SAM-dependent methyltransferase